MAGRVLPRVHARAQVLLHRDVLEDSATLHHLDDTRGYDVLGLHREQVGALVLDRTFGGLTVVEVEESANGPHRGGLAGAIGPEQSDDPTVRHPEADAPKYRDDAVVDDFEVRDREQEGRSRQLWPGSLWGTAYSLTSSHVRSDMTGRRTRILRLAS